METVLLVHHGRPHFEIVLALYDNLRHHFSLALWSDCLHVFDRESALREVGLSLHQHGSVYDYAIIISGDEFPSESDLPADVWRLIHERPTARVKHRFRGSQAAGEIFLFPRAEKPFVPVSTGLGNLKQSPVLDASNRRLLIQGNVEDRRNYSLLSTIGDASDAIEIQVCGLKVNQAPQAHKRVTYHFNLSEIDFHSICANAHFIMPMIDPKRYSGYFTDRASSSVQIGLSYSLPFIAHRALFGLYPITGFEYETDEDLVECVKRAAAITADEYGRMAEAMRAHRNDIETTNAANIRELLNGI